MNADHDFLARIQSIPNLDGLSDIEAARALSTVQLDLMFRGTGFEDAANRARNHGDTKLLASFIGQWRRELPRLVAGAKARAAILDSPAACLLLGRMAELMLHRSTTPDDLQEAARMIEQRFERLK